MVFKLSFCCHIFDSFLLLLPVLISLSLYPPLSFFSPYLSLTLSLSPSLCLCSSFCFSSSPPLLCLYNISLYTSFHPSLRSLFSSPLVLSIPIIFHSLSLSLTHTLPHSLFLSLSLPLSLDFDLSVFLNLSSCVPQGGFEQLGYKNEVVAILQLVLSPQSPR